MLRALNGSIAMILAVAAGGKLRTWSGCSTTRSRSTIERSSTSAASFTSRRTCRARTGILPVPPAGKPSGWPSCRASASAAGGSTGRPSVAPAELKADDPRAT
eukprot:scaffold276_cov116-Isochrysis_galbana.AAC.15